MRLDEFRSQIISSGVDDWEVIHLADGRERWQATGDIEVWPEGGPEWLAHLRADLDISIAYGADQNRGEEWGGSWVEFANGFPDKRVFGRFAEFRWHGEPIERHLLVAVDGYRHVLPSADAEWDGPAGPSSNIVGWKVTSEAVQIARLIDVLAGHHGFEEAMLAARYNVKD